MIAGITSNSEGLAPSLSITPESWYGSYTDAEFPIVAGGVATVSVLNGSGAYTFVWTKLSGHGRFSVDSPYTNTLSFVIADGVPNASITAVFRCTVNGDGLVNETIDITVDVDLNSGGVPL